MYPLREWISRVQPILVPLLRATKPAFPDGWFVRFQSPPSKLEPSSGTATTFRKQLMFLSVNPLLKLVAQVRLSSLGHHRILGVLSSFDTTWKCGEISPLPVSSRVPPLVRDTCMGK